MNLDARDRFEVIIDKVFKVNTVPTAAVTGEPNAAALAMPDCHSELVVDEFRKLKRRDVQYKSDGLAATDIQTGCLWFWLTCEDTVAEWGFQGNARLRYYDN
jgi:hypothetical protein